MNKTFSFFILLSLIASLCHADNIKQITNADGLSNSAILSICQDTDGYVWIGTCDGVNLYNGRTINTLRSSIYSLNLSGNLIENILEEGDDIIWINTNYSLNRLDKKKWEVKSFPEIQGRAFLALDTKGTLFSLIIDNKIRYFDNVSKTLKEVTSDVLHYTQIIHFFISSDNVLHILSKDKTNAYRIVYDKNNVPQLIKIEEQIIPIANYCYVDDTDPDILNLIDTNNQLFSFNLKTKEKQFIYDLNNEIITDGKISTIVRFDNEYYVGFKSKGLIKLVKTEQSNTYELVKTFISTGVFSMKKDRFQDLLWIGTDGGGIYILSKDTYTVNSYTFKDLNIDASMPVRAIYVDDQDVWIGTKGDGLIKMANFDGVKSEKIEYYNTDNTKLLDDAVYVIEKSQHNILWVGTELGLDYYSKKEKKIRNLDLSKLDFKIRYIHDIVEINDSTLWLATVGEGIFKLKLNWNNDVPSILKVQQILAGEKHFHNSFFKIYHDIESARLWFGNRGFGTYYIDYNQNDSLHNIKFNNISSNQSINDIYSIAKDQQSNMWFGTSMGLIKQESSKDTQLFNQNVGFSNDLIHSIIKDSDDDLWLGTNKGIIRFDTKMNIPYCYDGKVGLSVVEYSDGASFRDPKTKRIYFGGINGIAYVDKFDFKHKYYKPQIRLEEISIYGQHERIADLLQLNKGQVELELTYRQDVFALDFIALDFIDASNFTYYYKIEGKNETWIDNGSSGLISFTKLQPGEYNIKVRYKNNSSGLDSDIYSLRVHIKPPWYLSTFAYLIYTLLIIGAVICGVLWLIKRNNRKKEQAIQEIKLQHQQENYNTKLSFFANIATEFLDPLTLIYTPCSQIIGSKGDQSIRNSAYLIRKNAEKINDLTQSLIEFAKYETEEIKPIVKPFLVKEMIDKLLELFDSLAKNKAVTLKQNIEEILTWNSDRNFLQNIIMNLLSQTIEYANNNSMVSVKSNIENNNLYIEISCSSSNVQEFEPTSNFMHDKLFNSDIVEAKSTLLTDVGLALTDKLVQLLEGSIDFELIGKRQIAYTVTIPSLEITEGDHMENIIFSRKSMYETTEQIQLVESIYDPNKHTITLLYDNQDTLWTLNEIFKEIYNIQAFANKENIQSSIHHSPSDLIITDLSVNAEELFALIRKIKSIDSISHIPIIVLSSRYTTAEQVEGVNAGVLMFISKPFDIEHLKATMQAQMIGKDKLKKYFDSPLSAYVVNEGTKTHKEVIAFKTKIKDIINKNIENSGLSVQFISDELNMSSRQLYRKIKEMEIDSLTELIKDGRLNYSRKLLINSKLTIDEIIFKSGFSNRATFFRAFNQKYNCTPKEYRDKNLN